MSRTDGRGVGTATRFSFWRCAIAALFFASVSVVGQANSASAASNGQWSVFPTTPTGQAPREVFQTSLTPSEPYRDAVTVSNYTSGRLTFNLYGSDAINTPGGGLSLRPRTQVQRDIGDWIHLPFSRLTVQAHRASVVPFTIDPPPQATPGDHVGGIVAEDTEGTASRAGSLPITVIQAVGVRIYGRVVGSLHPQLALPDMSVAVQRSAASQFNSSVNARVTFRVLNSGNTLLSPTVTAHLTSPIGTAARKRFVVNDLLPGSSLRYSMVFTGVITYGHLRIQVVASSPGAGASRVSETWTVPWALLALVAFALVFAVRLLVRWRRKRRAQIRTEPRQSTVPADV